MSLNNPDSRRALRSTVEAIVALCLVGLLWWLTSLLRGVPTGLEGISRGALIILGLNAVFYGAENVTRAIKLTGPLGTSAEFGPDGPVPQAAQAVADSAQTTADAIKGRRQMIALLARKLALTLLLALAVVALLEQFNPSPPQMLDEDTTRPFHHAQLGIPDNARPILQRCYPVEPASHDAVAAIGLEQEPVT